MFCCYGVATTLRKRWLSYTKEWGCACRRAHDSPPPRGGGDSSLNRSLKKNQKNVSTRSMSETGVGIQTKPNQTSPRPVWTGSGVVRALGDSLPSPLLKFLPRAHTQQKKSKQRTSARTLAHTSLPSLCLVHPASPIGSCGHLEPPLVLSPDWFGVRTVDCDWLMWVRALLAHWLVWAVHEREGKSCKREARAGKDEA